MFWSKLAAWCKERWELITGVVVGILAVLAAIKSGGTKKVLEKKNELRDEVQQANEKAITDLESSIDENVEKFLSKDDEIKKELKTKLKSLDKEKKERVNDLIKSGSPEEEIAEALKEILK
tara:strand:+ start:1087 stop:1449 length:363 start_codon:yes stop_codon:yes gene_type:complete